MQAENWRTVSNKEKVGRDERIMAGTTRRRWKRHGWLLGCALALCACTAFSVRQRGDIPAALPGRFGNGATAPAMSIFWQESFASEHLRADVRSLLEENFELEAARARVAQAACAYGIVKSALIPALDGQVDLDRSRIRDDDEDDAITARNTIAFQAALHWEPDLWGRLRARKRAAALSLAEQRALADQTALDLQSLLVESWIAHHAARRLERVLAAQRKTNAQLLSLTELRCAQGQGSALAVLQQRGRLAASERTLPAVTAEKRRAADAYAVLAGRFPDGGDLPQDVWPVLEPLLALPTPHQLLAARPDARAALLALQAADHQTAAAVADRLPSLSVGLSYQESGSGLSHLGDGSVFCAAGDLLAPVFDAGRLSAAANQRRAEARELLAVFEQTARIAVREVEDALAGEQALLDECTRLRRQIAIALDTVEKTKLSLVNGQASYLAVLLAVSDLQVLQQTEIMLQQAMLINRVHLLKALGAEWSRNCEAF